jgi:hypothetical protein
MAVMYLTLTADTEQLTQDLQLLAESSERFPQIGQRLLDFLELFGEGGCVHAERVSTAIADQGRIRFYLADPLAELVAAIRAGEFDAL